MVFKPPLILKIRLKSLNCCSEILKMRTTTRDHRDFPFIHDSENKQLKLT